MKLKTLDRAAKILEEIKLLDEQIVSLEKWAESLVNGHYEIDMGRVRCGDEDKGTEKFEVKTNEAETLYMIGALLSIKNDKRNELIASIKKLGYE